MPIPVYNNPPNSDVNVNLLVAAALNLYRAGRIGGTLHQHFYQDNIPRQCINGAAGDIIRNIEHIQHHHVPDHGAIVGTLNGNVLLHATWTHHGAGNCSLICEYNPNNPQNPVTVHAIGAHTANGYEYDGVSAALDAVLTANMESPQHVCRYTNDNHNAVRF